MHLRKHVLLLVVITAIFILTLSCGSSTSHSLLGIKFLEEEKEVSALLNFNEVLAEHPNDSLALYGKGTLLIENQMTSFIGFSLLEKSLEGLSEKKYRKGALLLILEYNIQKKMFEQVDIIFDKITDEGFIDLSVYQVLMDSYIQQKNYKKTIQLLENGLKIYKIDVLEENIAYIYLKYLKNYKKSYQVYTILYEKTLNPKYLYFLINISYLRKHYKTSLMHLKNLKEKHFSWFEKENISLLEKSIKLKKYIPRF